MFWERFPATALLMGTANALSLLIAIPLGVISALRQYSRLDNLVTVLAFAGIAMPSFTFSLVTLYLFGVVLHWFPLGSMRSIGVSSVLDLLWHLALPAGVLTFVTTAYWMRFVRSSVLEVIRQDYVVLALAKGLPGRVVITKYVLRNACLPLITLFGLSLPELFTGSMIVEWIFNWPGVGQMILRAGNNHDFTVVMGIVTIVSIVVVIGNLAADLAYSWADPRIKY